jgi:hypothetical protein
MACLLALVPGSASAGQGALEPDPNVLRTLDALGPNEAITLGQARVIGPFNDVARRFGLDRTGPRSRDYSIKMVWAPERRRALFVGANHGGPHRLNDVWEFDLAAMAWVLLYAPDNPRSYAGLGEDFSDVEFKDGVLMTKRGGPAIIAHTWWGITYEPRARQLLFMDTWVTNRDEAIRSVGGDPANRYAGPPLWAFSPETGAWNAIRTPAPRPPAPFGAALEYVPELGGAIWHMNNWQMSATWLYDPVGDRWSNLNANAVSKDFSGQAPGRELVTYYDPKRQLVIAQRGKSTFHFNTLTRQWRKAVTLGESSPAAPFGHDARTPFYYDRASGQGLLVDLQASAIWTYDPDAFRWTKLVPKGASMPTGSRMLVYADPARNVLVVIDDTLVWAYRYRAAP